jgi:DUF177 domain-containing protein
VDAETSKTTTCTRFFFDRGGNPPYYTRPMAAGLPDRVDCAHLADDAVVLERVYSLGDMSRLQDLLADARGSVRAKFAFAKVDSGRAGATVAVEACPQLICQRCLQGFAHAVAGSSEIEFSGGMRHGAAPGEAPGATDSQREIFATDEGLVSLRELAEEELLLALPLVAVCSTPQTCGRAPAYEAGEERAGGSDDRTRPFTALRDLLKKT